MSWFQGVFFLLVGVGLVLVASNGKEKGILPFGSRGFRRLLVMREEHPLGFGLLWLAYLAAGLGLVVFALLLMTGYAQPLPLR